MKQLDGPFLAPKSGKAKHLVIFLHGYGDSGAGLLPIGEEWRNLLPDAAFVAPNAIDVCEVFAAGYQWFPIRAAGVSREAFDRREIVQPPTQALHAFIDAQLEKWGVDEKNLAVVGFSQGAMMAMYAMPRRQIPCAAVIGYSGMLVDAEGLKALEIVKMPILVVHGDRDEVVPPECLIHAEEGLAAAGFDVETIMRPGLGHGIDDFGLMRGVQFIRDNLGKIGA